MKSEPNPSAQTTGGTLRHDTFVATRDAGELCDAIANDAIPPGGQSHAVCDRNLRVSTPARATAAAGSYPDGKPGWQERRARPPVWKHMNRN